MFQLRCDKIGHLAIIIMVPLFRLLLGSFCRLAGADESTPPVAPPNEPFLRTFQPNAHNCFSGPGLPAGAPARHFLPVRGMRSTRHSPARQTALKVGHPR